MRGLSNGRRREPGYLRGLNSGAVDDCHVICVVGNDVNFVGGRVRGNPNRAGVIRDADGLNDHIRLAVDHRDTSAALIGDVDFIRALVHRDSPRRRITAPHFYGSRDRVCIAVYDCHIMGAAVGDVNPVRLRVHRDALRG
ncbi:hypothetical protein SDC9_56878 [bioreactor metagenome]|uniref:Uncharacterized protein n=1 Tax=bioreactor metagenome TaxID=1076179 RepID=A0A644X344_9ZZZZ